MSIDRGMDKEDVVHIFKKVWNNAICSNMDGPRDCQWSKSDREKQIS